MTLAPFPASVFFAAHPDQAKPRPGRAPTARDLTGEISKINRMVNKAIRPRKEKSDKWSIYPSYGDCDDYVVTKRHELLKRGYASSTLRIAICQLASGEKHAVLLVSSALGEYVLDNLNDALTPRARCRHRFISVQSADHPTQFEAYQ